LFRIKRHQGLQGVALAVSGVAKNRDDAPTRKPDGDCARLVPGHTQDDLLMMPAVSRDLA
jgi:hypothetical protein